MDGEVLTDRLRWREAEEVKFAGFANAHPCPVEAEFGALDLTEPHRFVERHTRRTSVTLSETWWSALPTIRRPGSP